jgi:glycosyltransferase involved in cell wall biosynthesis
LKPLPRISVVIPSFNQGRFIEETIRSIVMQQWPDLEFIVIDGGSSDDTPAIIRTYSPWIAHWVSEPDRGQADAINTGLRRTTGDIVTWFSADDLYTDGIFAAVAEAWRRSPRAIYAAPVVNFSSRRRQTLVRPHGLSLENVVQYWRGRSHWHDPGLFWSRAVIDAVGEIDTSLLYAFDYDYLARALQHFSVEYVDHVAAGFRLHRQSKTISQSEQMMSETAAVSQRYWPLVKDLDREGFERAEFEARVRRAASKLLRLNREGLPLLWRVLRERPLAALLRLACLFPTVLFERFGRLPPGDIPQEGSRSAPLSSA